jgi:hypothetical protein
MRKTARRQKGCRISGEDPLRKYGIHEVFDCGLQRAEVGGQATLKRLPPNPCSPPGLRERCEALERLAQRHHLGLTVASDQRWHGLARRSQQNLQCREAGPEPAQV